MALGAPETSIDSQGVGVVAEPEWGTKRTCLECGAKFYDFSREPIVCPSCEAVFKVVVPGKQRRNARAERRSAPAPKPVDEAAPEKIDDEKIDDEKIDDEKIDDEKIDDEKGADAKGADAKPDDSVDDDDDPKAEIEAEEDEGVAIVAEAGLVGDDEEDADEDENADSILEANSNEDIEAELNSEIDTNIEKEKEG